MRRTPAKEKDYRRLKWFIRTRICISLFACGTNCLTVIRKPRVPIFLTSLMNHDGPWSSLITVPGKAFHIYIYVTQYYCLLFIISTTMYSCYCAVGGIKRVHLKGENWMEYRVLSVLQTYYNAMFQNWLSCQVFLDMFGIIVNIYLAVILSSFRGMIITCLTLFSAGWSYTGYSTVYEESNTVLKAWMTRAAGKHDGFHKFQRSCKPVTVNIGKSFYVDRALLLTLSTIIIDKTTSLLVLHGK